MHRLLATQATVQQQHRHTPSALPLGAKASSTEYPASGVGSSWHESSTSNTRGPQPRAGTSQRDSAGNHNSYDRGLLNYIGGWFNYAYGFTINNPLMAEHIHINKQASIGLIWLEGRAMSGVELHSEARAPPPHCYQGTRLKLIQMIQSWLHDSDPTQKLLWLSGPAGVGKSAIMQTLAEAEEKLDRLGATLFFPQIYFNAPLPGTSSLSRQSTLPRLWITVAYRLATKHPLYLAYVEDRISKDPTLVDANMERQFDILIAEPFGRAQLVTPSHFLPIFIDGLDHFHAIDTQKRVIQLITTFIRDYPSAPLVWVVASRRETHLANILSEGQGQKKEIHCQFVPVESPDALADVKHFLHGRFNEVKLDYRHVIELPWPKVDDFSHLLLAASGLFLFATAVMNFIADSSLANPTAQFNSVLSSIVTPPSDSDHPVEPLETVYDMYAQILGTIPPKSYPTSRRILGFFVLPSGFGGWARDATPFWSLCNILNIARNDAYSCLTMLHSLLDIPTPKEAIWTPLRPFHSSFSDYLANPNASKKFWIDPSEVMEDLWQCHFRVLQEINTETDEAPEVSKMRLSWPSSPEDDEELRNDTWENARRALFHHLSPCPSDPCPFGIHYTDLSDGQYTPKFVEVFEKINFRVLLDGYVPLGAPHPFIAFLDWLVSDEHIPLQENNLLQKLDNIDQRSDWINRASTSFRITVTHFDDDVQGAEGGRITTIKAYTDQVLTEEVENQLDANRPFSTGEKPEPLTELLKCLGMHDSSSALLVGSKTAGQCVVLAHKSVGNRTYYLLPCNLLSPPL